jgi:hypothetical protein
VAVAGGADIEEDASFFIGPFFSSKWLMVAANKDHFKRAKALDCYGFQPFIDSWVIVLLLMG